MKADETPLHVAAREGKVDLIKFLLTNHKKLIDIECKMMDGWTPVFYAAVNGYLITVETLVKDGWCELNAVDRFERTVLHWAARYNNKPMVKLLLDLGTHFDKRDCEGLTASDLSKANGAYEVA